ncbi:MAG: hypothetical protein KY459_15135 [Acidobacteria bacterium]|nr:hypothetical protein [Acidobacteriota bacterium]
MLVPIFIPTIVGGAGGSRWQSELWVFNDSEDDVEVIPNVWFIAPIPERSTVRPKVVTGLRMFGYPPAHTANVHRAVPARLVFVDKAYSGDIFFSAYVLGPTAANRTMIPVVREPDFRTTSVTVMGIPVSKRARLTVRVYEPDIQPSTQVVVRVQTLGTARLLLEQTLELATIPSECCFAHVPSYPNYAQLTFRSEAFSDVDEGGLLQVEIRSVPEGRRLWALISATDDVTHETTLYWPN